MPETMPVLELNPSDLGTLELDNDLWVAYVDLYGEVPYVPTVVRVGATEYTYVMSTIVFGHGAELPAKVRELRASGKSVLVIQRGSSGSGGKNERYLVFAG
jgi:hypothetical protein